MVASSSAIVRRELSAPFTEFNLAADRLGFIGPKVLRPWPAAIQAGDVGKVPLKALLQGGDDERAPGAPYNRDDWEFDNFSYVCKDHGREAPLDDGQLAVYKDIIDAEQVTSDRAIDKVLRNYEIAAAATLYNTTTWTGAALTSIVSNEWNDTANCTPVSDIQAARLLVRAGSGLYPNALIINRRQVWALANSSQMLDRLKYAGFDDPKKVTAAALAVVFQIDHIIIAGGLSNSANAAQAASIGEIWSDEYAMLAKVAISDDPQEPCVGRTFLWTGDGPGATGTDEELAVITEEYRDEPIRGSVFRARNNRDIVVMYAAAGHLLSNVIDPTLAV